jgi:hypothetical protein
LECDENHDHHAGEEMEFLTHDLDSKWKLRKVSARQAGEKFMEIALSSDVSERNLNFFLIFHNQEMKDEHFSKL